MPALFTSTSMRPNLSSAALTISASSEYDVKIAVLRQLLAWERDLSGPASQRAREANQGLFEDRIYVLTPDAAIVELPQGATTVDFAYSVHTSLGHRCRGARIDGAMVPLNTPLQNGQTVEVITAKEGGPSRDWLNPELGFLSSHRAKSKVRAWFNAQEMAQTVAKGREAGTAEREALRAEGLKREAELMNGVRAETAQTLERGRVATGSEADAARKQLRLDAHALGRDMAARVLGREVTS